MNRAQKNAWFGLGFSLIALVLILFIGAISISRAFQTFGWIFGLTIAAALIFTVLVFCSLIFRKRKSGDIEADERDWRISNLAIKISFIFIWPLLLIADTLTVCFAGITGSVPPILFIIIHLGVFIFSATIYFLSTLVLYQTKGGVA